MFLFPAIALSMLAIIFKILTAITKIIKFFLFRLLFWIPALFVLGYFVLMAIMGQNFLIEDRGRVILIVGSVVLTVIALTLALSLRFRKMQKKQPATETPRDSYSGSKRRDDYFYDDDLDDDYYFDYRPRKKRPSRWQDEPFDEFDAPSGTSYYESAQTQERKTRFTDGAAQASTVNNFKDYTTQTESQVTATTAQGGIMQNNLHAGSQEQINTVSALPMPNRSTEYARASFRARNMDENIFKPAEKPLVFSTRKDPDILILEYSDRLMFFRKSKDGGEPEFLAEEFKQR